MESEVMKTLRLPDEVIFLILAAGPPHGALRLVCRQWNSLYACQRLLVDCSRLDFLPLLAFKAPALFCQATSVELQSYAGSSFLLQEFLAKFPRLSHLTLRDCPVEISVFKSSRFAAKTLKSLEIIDCHVTRDVLDGLLSEAVLPALTSLAIDSTTYAMRDLRLQKIAHQIIQAKGARLTGLALVNPDEQLLLATLPKDLKLERLVLTDFLVAKNQQLPGAKQHVPDTVDTLITTLKSFSNLTQLCFSRSVANNFATTRQERASLDSLFDALAVGSVVLEQLAHLSLIGYIQSPLASLAKAIANLPALRRLSLRGTVIYTQELESVLADLPLEELDLISAREYSDNPYLSFGSTWWIASLGRLLARARIGRLYCKDLMNPADYLIRYHDLGAWGGGCCIIGCGSIVEYVLKERATEYVTLRHCTLPRGSQPIFSESGKDTDAKK